MEGLRNPIAIKGNVKRGIKPKATEEVPAISKPRNLCWGVGSIARGKGN